MFRSFRRHRNYRIFFTGQLVSLAGTWMQNVALAWLVLELSDSPLAVGALAFWRFVPFTVFSLFAGVLADRIESRKLVIGTQVAAMAVSAVLAAVSLTDLASLPLVYALAALAGIALAFDAPGRQALTYQMVGPRELPNAVALNAGLMNGSRIVGPAIAGLVIAVAGTGMCFVLNVVSFLGVLTALAFVRTEELHPVRRDPSARIVAGLVRAFSFAWHDVQLRLILLVVLVVGTVGFNFHVVVPLLAAHTLHVGPEGFGLLSAAFGAGALVGALAAATFREASWRMFTIGTTAFGLLAFLLAPVENAVVAGLLLVAIASTLVQLRSPDHLRGRMIGLYLFAFVGLAPIGGPFAGWLVELGGTALALSVAGTTALGAIGLANVLRARADVALGSPAGRQSEVRLESGIAQ
jgi:MFS family permease